jgi:hypothetical protein
VTETLSGCARSSGSYVGTVAARLSLTAVNASCGAASTLDLTESQATLSGPIEPQLDALTSDTELVSVGLGANDQQLFATLFSTCVVHAVDDPQGSPCQQAMATSADGDLLMDQIPTIRARLVAALARISKRAPAADIVLVGYPQLVPETGTCAALPLASGDYPYVRGVWTALGEAMADAADEAGVIFVEMLDRSAGHDVCAGPDAWVNGATDDPERAAAYHPFAAEQAVVADLIVAAV